MPRDLYAALGRPRKDHEKKDGSGSIPLPRDATQAEVDKAADAALLRHHPDRNPSDDGSCAPGSASARYRDAKLAREILCDPEKRANYDAGLWQDPDDPPTTVSGEPTWHRAIKDPALRAVLEGCVESACVLGGLDQDAAKLAGDVTMGAVASAVEAAGSSREQIADRAKLALVTAGKKIRTPEGRAALREAGESAKSAWRKLFA
jgi:curved DNA-binding protein CbpA